MGKQAHNGDEVRACWRIVCEVLDRKIGVTRREARGVCSGVGLVGLASGGCRAQRLHWDSEWKLQGNMVLSMIKLDRRRGH